MDDEVTNEGQHLLSSAGSGAELRVDDEGPISRTSKDTRKKQVKIHMSDVVEYSRIAKHHFKQYIDKRAGWAPFLYGLLAVSAILLLARESQVVRSTTKKSFFYNVDDLHNEHRASCLSRREENATISKVPPLPLCQAVSQGSLTPSSLWKAHQDQLLRASKHPKDRAGRHLAWQQALLEFVGPNILVQALRNAPSGSDVRRIIQIIDTRRNAMHRKFVLKDKTVDFNKAPMLQIAVFGGSVPEGKGCDNFPDEILPYLPKYVPVSQRSDTQIIGKECAWPYRLQQLADAFLGKWVVDIHNLAVGGTNSRLTIPTLEYQLYREQALLDAGGADVIINGYAVNDNLKDDASWPTNTTSNNLHYDANLAKAQEFAQKALESRPCRDPPVVIFFDDVFGNHNGEIIMGDDVRSDAVRFVTDMYNLMHISSVAPVKHFVQANEKETLFSPSWYAKRGNGRTTNGHYGMPGHQYAAYTIAYSMLQSLVGYCVEEEFYGGGTNAVAMGKHTIHPPTIDGNSKLSTIATEWKDDAAATLRREQEYCETTDAKAQPCAFAFVSNPAGTVRDAKELNRYIDGFIKNKRADNTGWIGRNEMSNGWQNKVGFAATTPGSSVLLTISDIQNPIQKLVVQYLKSYGDKWAGSKAEFDLRVYESANTGAEPLFRKSFVLAGEWEDQYSISFQEIVNFRDNAATKGQTVTLRITLTGGTEFKIMGLMLCSR
ncbi:hypothetical protein MPSEU_000060300 [Mayamaea pseudoterrestris]|nr:hypothetical protein MPSEU_000060300 [Mayamaea pseudoterrestris]